MNGQAPSIELVSNAPTVYVALVGDILHAGHINIINRARSLGRVILGILTDDAAASYKRVPLMAFEERKLIFDNMKGIERVVPQNALSYRENLLAFKPRFVVHGDDWRQGIQASVRTEAIDLLREWGGELVEVPYTQGVSSTLLREGLREQGILAGFRQGRLRSLIESKPLVRVMEVHSPLAALVVERTTVDDKGFDAFWSSSLTDSIMHGKPDIEVVDYRTRVASIVEMFEVTTKPLIYDGDSGRSPEHAYHLSRALDACGVSGLCLEDKIGPKLNSLYGVASSQRQSSVAEFCDRLRAVKAATSRSSMMTIARIESLVLGHSMEDALERADAYRRAGAEAILIHSVRSTPDEVFAFTESFKTTHTNCPVIIVPTTYGDVYESEMIERGVNVVIYANHLLRASYPAMIRAAKDILAHGRAAEVGAYCADPSELITLFLGQ